MPWSVTLIPGQNLSHFKFVFSFLTHQKKLKVSCNLFYNLLKDLMNLPCTLICTSLHTYTFFCMNNLKYKKSPRKSLIC